MKKVWNVQKRQYEWEQEGIFVDGLDLDQDQAYQKWVERGGNARKITVKRIIQNYVGEKKSFDKFHKFVEQIENDVLILNHKYVNTYLGKQDKKISYQDIPDIYKPGIQNIAEQTAKDLDRGHHNTCPSKNGAAHSYREYHLINGSQDGRATTAQADGMILIYYSTTHAFATYNYHLVTFEFKKVEVPLLAGNVRDKMIKWPWVP